MKHDPITNTGPARAFVLFRSGGRLDLLNPRFDCWTDEDLALNLARISRWGGATRWREPLSVAQHSLVVLQIREREEVLTPREALRELLHDASEGLLGWDPIGPLKDHLGEPFRKLEQRLQALVGERYALPAWDAAAYRRHKAADRLDRPRKPVTSSAGAARTCAMRSESSVSPSRRILFRCLGSNRGSLGRRGSPSRCFCTGCSTFEPQPSCTKARSRDHARPLRTFA